MSLVEEGGGGVSVGEVEVKERTGEGGGRVHGPRGHPNLRREERMTRRRNSLEGEIKAAAR